MKKNGGKRYLYLLILIALAALLAGGRDILRGQDVPDLAPTAAWQTILSATDAPKTAAIDKDGAYYGKDEVALYIHTYGRLPDNFITKAEAQKLGWEGGSIEKFAPGCAIGGDHFGNYEGALPEKKGRTYTECDIDTRGASSRGAQRVVFSSDGLIYYTGDHYETFELLYGKESP